MAKPGLDGHVVGFLQVSRALRDAGFEVILAGVRQTPDTIAEAAVQEDVDVVGLSILSGAHLSLVPRVLQGLRDAGAADIPVMVGGVIPPRDVEKLRKLGMAAYFGPGSSFRSIIDFVAAIEARRAAAGQES
jgi:methylmalonyl-CoA mutase C-terminal domain/subunit